MRSLISDVIENEMRIDDVEKAVVYDTEKENIVKQLLTPRHTLVQELD